MLTWFNKAKNAQIPRKMQSFMISNHVVLVPWRKDKELGQQVLHCLTPEDTSQCISFSRAFCDLRDSWLFWIVDHPVNTLGGAPSSHALCSLNRLVLGPVKPLSVGEVSWFKSYCEGVRGQCGRYKEMAWDEDVVPGPMKRGQNVECQGQIYGNIRCLFENGSVN